MKAKHFKKLRKQVSIMRSYNIYETVGLFGNIWIHPDNVIDTVKAMSYDEAMRKFLKRYHNKQLKRHRLDNLDNYTNNSRTVEMWGKIAIQDTISDKIEYYG